MHTPGPNPALGSAPLLPLLVASRCWRSEPLCPFDVARTEGFTVAVFSCLPVTVDVENVIVDLGSTSESASEVRKTSAKPGAGTSMLHVPALWSHWTVEMLSCPLKRPSAPFLSALSQCGVRDETHQIGTPRSRSGSVSTGRENLWGETGTHLTGPRNVRLLCHRGGQEVPAHTVSPKRSTEVAPYYQTTHFTETCCGTLPPANDTATVYVVAPVGSVT